MNMDASAGRRSRTAALRRPKGPTPAVDGPAAVLRAQRDRLPKAGFRVPYARIVTQITEGFAVLR